MATTSPLVSLVGDADKHPLPVPFVVGGMNNDGRISRWSM